MKTTPINKKDIQQVNINTHPAISGKSNIFFFKISVYTAHCFKFGNEALPR